ncbi:unnamed protein product [Calicophoron daubneyi]|uniref:Apoptosis regulator BAX n=1 Tax=Calicophoron daubneyi TaxID=300641 RepID=A0AAV2SZA0_CALDB
MLREQYGGGELTPRLRGEHSGHYHPSAGLPAGVFPGVSQVFAVQYAVRGRPGDTGFNVRLEASRACRPNYEVVRIECHVGFDRSEELVDEVQEKQGPENRALGYPVGNLDCGGEQVPNPDPKGADRQTREVISEFFARVLEEAKITVEKIPVSDETKEIATELIDLSKNCRGQYEDLFGHGNDKDTDIGDAASRLFGDGVKWEKIAMFLQFVACCYIAYKRRDVLLFIATVTWYFKSFHIQEWVENHGGWGAVIRANRTPIALSALGIVGALVLIGFMCIGR